MTIEEVFAQTDWPLLSQQKLALVNIDLPWADGLVGFIDAVQDAAEAAGYPVVWMSDDEPERRGVW